MLKIKTDLEIIEAIEGITKPTVISGMLFETEKILVTCAAAVDHLSQQDYEFHVKNCNVGDHHPKCVYY